MQPQDPNQQNNQPASDINQFAWSAADLMPAQAPEDPRAKMRKRILLIAGVSLGFLVFIAVIASLSSSGSKTPKGTNVYVPGPETQIEQSNYDSDVLTLKYPKSLSIAADDPLEEEYGRSLQLIGNDANVGIYISGNVPEYEDNDEAIIEVAPDGVELVNIKTTSALNAGQRSEKITAEYTDAEKEYVVFYSKGQVGERYVIASGTYLKESKDITDSLDAMLGSIKLK